MRHFLTNLIRRKTIRGHAPRLRSRKRPLHLEALEDRLLLHAGHAGLLDHHAELSGENTDPFDAPAAQLGHPVGVEILHLPPHGDGPTDPPLPPPPPPPPPPLPVAP